MRNMSKVFRLRNGWYIKITYFSRDNQIGIGLCANKKWIEENRFSSKILLSYEEAKRLCRKLQSLLDKVGEKNGKEKKEKEET